MTEIYQVGHLERVPLGTPYPGIVAHVGRLLGKLPGRPELAIDLTGVGRPVFDMFRYSGISPVGVQITGGAVETRDGVICNVPKLTLVSRLQALLHEGRLKILRDLPEAETLVRELQDFRVEFTAAGHLTFNARAGKHDDLVLALAIATWSACGGGMESAGAYEFARQQGLGIAANEPRYFVGVDLGQSHDPTAIAIVRKIEVEAPAAAAYRDAAAEGVKKAALVDPARYGSRRGGATGPLAPSASSMAAPSPVPTGPVPDDYIHADGRTEWARRRDELWARETPDHPEVRGGAVEHVNGPQAKLTYAKGSMEWQEEQERLRKP